MSDDLPIDEFRVPASDTRGHSTRLWFRCMPMMARLMEQVIQSRAFPYRTNGDILRHALNRHIHWLNETAPVKSLTGQVDAILEVLRDEEMNSDFTSVFDKLGERISAHVASGASGEARRILLRIRTLINDMPEGHWKDKYNEEVSMRYGHLIKQAPKAKLKMAENE